MKNLEWVRKRMNLIAKELNLSEEEKLTINEMFKDDKKKWK